MKATDLMIGDWVIRRCVPEEPMRLYNMNSSRGIAYLDQDGRGVAELFENIEPIPLTPKILDKNKFFQVGYPNNVYELNKQYYLDHYDAFKPKLWVLYFGNYMRGKVEDTKIKITYVHELQHALKLCGIEKEIIL